MAFPRHCQAAQPVAGTQNVSEHLAGFLKTQVEEKLTRVFGRTGLAGLSEAMVWVSTAAFRLGDCSWKGTSARSLFNASVAGAAHVGVHTDSSVHPDRQAPEALAAEGALRVNAPAIHTDSRRLALVDVWKRKDKLAVTYPQAAGHRDSGFGLFCRETWRLRGSQRCSLEHHIPCTLCWLSLMAQEKEQGSGLLPSPETPSQSSKVWSLLC